jgi:hypothetical protein
VSNFYERFGKRSSACDQFVEAQRERERGAENAAEREKQLQQVESTRRTQPLTPGGSAVDAGFIKARADYEISRRVPQAAVPTLPDSSVLYALIQNYALDTANGRHLFVSADNLSNLCNCVIRSIAELGSVLSIALVGRAHAWLLAHDYLELPPFEHYDPATKSVVKTRGSATRPAAKIYPPYVHPDVEVQRRSAALQATQAQWLQEVKVTKRRLDSGELKFADLQKDIRKDFKPPRPGGPEYGGA